MHDDLIEFVRAAIKTLNKLENKHDPTTPDSVGWYLAGPIQVVAEGSILAGHLDDEDGTGWKFVPNVTFTGKTDATKYSERVDDSGQDESGGG